MATNIEIGIRLHKDRIKIELEDADIDTLADMNINTAAKDHRKAVLREAVTERAAARADAAAAAGICFRVFDLLISYTGEDVGKGTNPAAFLLIVLELKPAQKLIRPDL